MQPDTEYIIFLSTPNSLFHQVARDKERWYLRGKREDSREGERGEKGGDREGVIKKNATNNRYWFLETF